MEHENVFSYPSNMSNRFVEVIPDMVYLDMLGTHVNLAIRGGSRTHTGTTWVTLDSAYKDTKDNDPAAELRALRDALNYVLKEQYGED